MDWKHTDGHFNGKNGRERLRFNEVDVAAWKSKEWKINKVDAPRGGIS